VAIQQCSVFNTEQYTRKRLNAYFITKKKTRLTRQSSLVSQCTFSPLSYLSPAPVRCNTHATGWDSGKGHAGGQVGLAGSFVCAHRPREPLGHILRMRESLSNRLRSVESGWKAGYLAFNVTSQLSPCPMPGLGLVSCLRLGDCYTTLGAPLLGPPQHRRSQSVLSCHFCTANECGREVSNLQGDKTQNIWWSQWQSSPLPRALELWTASFVCFSLVNSVSGKPACEG
jgi:hypothetical protein